ncbi:potassium/proton antiporter [Saccharopolyspora oryzae]|uniref:Potassium/proton antiporter n=1 Tax=Saccharopolyspora oryzae TaxID=2997343 RepID=A0ABT4UTS2_9PSEU|nr:potassium/proton antiporter [Saccharopolyspora oryzae]MDA3624467.1 potassium/proton antiporter [Saccharopolyspora oryzae]
MQQLYLVLLVGGLVLLAGAVAALLASRLGLPSLLIYLGLGVVLGEDVLGIKFHDAQIAQNLGTAALAIILIEGGLSTRWSDIRRLLAPATMLATIGVGISLVVTALGAHLLLGIDWQLSLLVGAIVSSTDAAAVFSVLRVLPLPKRLAGLLEAESGFNDAPTVIFVLLFSTVPLEVSPLEITVDLLYQLTIGAAIGLAIGVGGAKVLPRLALPAAGLYPVATFGLCVIAFAAGGAAEASGFLAAYLSGLALGNTGRLPHRSATRSFAEGLGWIAQIGLFVLLGLLVTPSELPGEVLPALVIGLVLLLVARPVSVVLPLVGFHVPWREQVFLSWAGLRGAVPIVLATFPIVQGVPGSQRVLDIVFVLVVAFTLVQAPSLRPLARLLGIIPREAPREIQLDSVPLNVAHAELLTMTVPPGSRLHHTTIVELRLPEPAVVPLVVRGGRAFVPLPDSYLEIGDELLVVTTVEHRAAAERRLRAVSRRGKLAHWFGEHGEPD